MVKKKRKIRVTREQVLQAAKDNKIKAKKNVVVPGPWTNLQTDLKINPRVRNSKGIVAEIAGVYSNDDMWAEKGWYPISINITSDDIFQKVQKYGLDQYIAAWEKFINLEDKKSYGTIVLLQATVDHSLNEDETHRFVSCRAKTNKKSIKGFVAIRKGKYTILE